MCQRIEAYIKWKLLYSKIFLLNKQYFKHAQFSYKKFGVTFFKQKYIFCINRIYYFIVYLRVRCGWGGGIAIFYILYDFTMIICYSALFIGGSSVKNFAKLHCVINIWPLTQSNVLFTLCPWLPIKIVRLTEDLSRSVCIECWLCVACFVWFSPHVSRFKFLCRW